MFELQGRGWRNRGRGLVVALHAALFDNDEAVGEFALACQHLPLRIVLLDRDRRKILQLDV